MRSVPRLLLTALVLAVVPVCPVRADDEVVLEVSEGLQPGEVVLDWAGGVPGFEVYRSNSASGLVDPSHHIGSTSGRTWSDQPPAEDILFYRVVGPCLTPVAEACDGVDDDCDGVVDNGCGPCQSSADCTAYDMPAVCSAPASCQGTRQQGICDVNQQCVAVQVDDDSACGPAVPSDSCGPYPDLFCTGDADQPSDQSSLCASDCIGDSDCDPSGHCDEAQNVCLDDFPAGFGCVVADDCLTAHCVDGVCCDASCAGTCAACDLSTPGTCSLVPDGEDPDAECGAVACDGYYYGFVGDTCYRKADVPGGQASCGGDGACRTAPEECSLQTLQGPGTLTCDGLCQDPTPSTCTGTIPGACTNVDPGTQTCGTGACENTVPSCDNGVPVTCVPGAPAAEMCNDVDDDCDGVVDNGSFADGLEPNGDCGSFRTLPTVASDQTLTQSTLTIYPSGDVDYFRINATETDSSCACCDFFCTDEDYRLKVSLTVPSNAGSYQFCAATSCADVATNCINVTAGSTQFWQFSLDGSCSGSPDTYAVYVRISPGASPGSECSPYILSYFFDALVCN